MLNLLLKLLNLPITLHIKFYPYVNRMILRSYGIVLGKNIQIPGKVHWLIRGGKVRIGDNFYFSSGDAVNPLGSNLQGAIYVENGASLTIGNDVGMSSTRMWIHDR